MHIYGVGQPPVQVQVDVTQTPNSLKLKSTPESYPTMSPSLVSSIILVTQQSIQSPKKETWQFSQGSPSPSILHSSLRSLLLFLFNESFWETEIKHHKIHSPEVFNSLVFSILFIMVCNNHNYQIPEHFHYKKKPCTP